MVPLYGPLRIYTLVVIRRSGECPPGYRMQNQGHREPTSEWCVRAQYVDERVSLHTFSRCNSRSILGWASDATAWLS